MEKSYSDSAKNVLEIAKEQARNFHHRIIGTEHVLLALVIEAKSQSYIYGNVPTSKLSFKLC